MLTMFAMVLAIGLLVDDAIVVVEKRGTGHGRGGTFPPGSHRKVHGPDHQRPDRHRAGALAVFGPMAFFGGSTGVIYRQFSVTVIASMLLSSWWP